MRSAPVENGTHISKNTMPRLYMSTFSVYADALYNKRNRKKKRMKKMRPKAFFFPTYLFSGARYSRVPTPCVSELPIASAAGSSVDGWSTLALSTRCRRPCASAEERKKERKKEKESK